MHIDLIDYGKFKRIEGAAAEKRSALDHITEEYLYSRDAVARSLYSERAALSSEPGFPRECLDLPAVDILARLKDDLPAAQAAARDDLARKGEIGGAASRIKSRVQALEAIVRAEAVVVDLAARRNALSAELAPLSALVGRLRTYVHGHETAPSFGVSTND